MARSFVVTRRGGGQSGGNARGRRPGLIVKDTLANRIKSQLAHKRYYVIAAAALLMVAAVLSGVLSTHAAERSVEDQGSSVVCGPSPDNATMIVTTLQPSASTTIAILTTTMTPPATPSVSTPNCTHDTMSSNASFVGAYDSSISPSQFSAVSGASDEFSCCRVCYDNQDAAAASSSSSPIVADALMMVNGSSSYSPSVQVRRQQQKQWEGGDCNGWGWLGGQCWIVYGYPGHWPDGVCPLGYPLVSIETKGPSGNYAGHGPCAAP
ncbi:hypothetical protein BX600DRAFT_555060 [Xylariales sp. PMI_506]|nr:hypothetical protein BX600DRAFT_555060 [Xylariales sp. PMI_506]